MIDILKQLTILVAEDDSDDRILAKEALAECGFNGAVNFVNDGEDLIDFLRRKNKYENLKQTKLPAFTLLDLGMPKKSGLEALREIKSDPQLRLLPIIVFTTSKAEEDVVRSYQLGVNSFITKPNTFNLLVDTMKTVTNYWTHVAQSPQVITTS